MKQLLFLLLLPCLAMAQYPGNAGQKITLGEQTTADGLVYRGVENDTALITPFSDTSAYIILDTVNNKFYNYNRATNVWSLAGGGTVTSVAALTLGTTGTDLSSTVANSTTTPVITLNVPDASATARGVVTTGTQTFGGNKTFTNLTAQNFVINVASASRGGLYPYNYLAGGGSTDYSIGLFSEGEIFMASGATATKRFTLKTNGQSIFTNLLVKGTGDYGYLNVDNSVTDFGGGAVSVLQNGVVCGGFGVQGALFGTSSKNVLFYSDVAKDMIFATIPTDPIITRMTIKSDGNVGIGTASPESGYKLHVVDSVYVGGNVSASAYTTRSDYDLKDEIQNISYGINEVMQMQPVKYTYKSNGSTQLGFIAQDLGVITPEVVSFEDKMSVYYNALIPILTKAIQEQQALIKALEQRLLILENK